jgi:hypothetical protein
LIHSHDEGKRRVGKAGWSVTRINARPLDESCASFYNGPAQGSHRPTAGSRDEARRQPDTPQEFQGGSMAEYLFDGKKLKKRSGQKEGELDGNIVKAWNGEQVGQIDGKIIKDSHGKKVLEFDGKNVKDDGGKKIATIEEVRKIIEGEAGVSIIAMWYFFVWK